MNRFKERLFVTLFTISFLININQCSNKSHDFQYSAEMTRIELSGVKTELSILNEEVNRLNHLLLKDKKQKENKVEQPPVSNKKVSTVKQVVIDSVPSQPILIETVDSAKKD